jgi:hypothetical protein
MRAPWRKVVSGAWSLRAAHVRASGEVQLDFAEHGDVLFGTEAYTWREMGEYRHFLIETWRAARI